MGIGILQYVQSYRAVNHCSTFYKLFSEWSAYTRSLECPIWPWWGRKRPSLLWSVIFQVTWSYLSDSCLAPHTDIPYVTFELYCNILGRIFLTFYWILSFLKINTAWSPRRKSEYRYFLLTELLNISILFIFLSFDVF